MIGVSGGYLMLKSPGWLVVNLIIGLFYIIDTFMQFFRSYYDDEGILVYELKKIARSYACSKQFLLNVISCFPTQATLYALNKFFFHVNSDAVDQSFLLFTMIDLVKLLRIARVRNLAKSSTYFRTLWEQQGVVTMMLVTFIMQLILFCHWLACFWSFIAFVQAQTFNFTNEGVSPTWISVWYESSYIPGSINPIGLGNDIDRYILALFWAIQSVTSIGYGNIAPVTRIEYFFASILMLMSGVFWAYAIGRIIQILDHVRSIDLKYKVRMDAANSLIRSFIPTGPNKESEIGVGDPSVTAKRIRRFITSQYSKKSLNYCPAGFNSKELEEVYPMIDDFSPELKRLSSLHLLRGILEMIPYLSSAYLTPAEQSQVAFKCVFIEFGRGDVFYEHLKYGRGIIVLKRGFCIASKKSVADRKRWYGKYNPIGINDVLVESDFLGKDEQRRLFFASYSLAVFIPRSVIVEVLKPRIWKECARWCYLQACLLKWAREKDKRALP
jgi:hypothetical protein